MFKRLTRARADREFRETLGAALKLYEAESKGNPALEDLTPDMTRLLIAGERLYVHATGALLGADYRRFAAKEAHPAGRGLKTREPAS